MKRKITEYLNQWNRAGRPEREPSKKSSKKKGGTPKQDPQKRTFSSDDDTQNADPNTIKSTPSKRKPSIEIIEIDDESPSKERVKAPAQESILNDLTEISQRIENLIQVKSMGLLTTENQKTLNKLMAQKEQRTSDLKRLQAGQLSSARVRERKRQCRQQLCMSYPAVAAELSKVVRPTTVQVQIETECPDLLQVFAEVARIGGTTNSNFEQADLTLDHLTNAIAERGYQIHKSSLYYR